MAKKVYFPLFDFEIFNLKRSFMMRRMFPSSFFLILLSIREKMEKDVEKRCEFLSKSHPASIV
jgi:hypothetical protein